jgi:cellobiose phosphorylase
MQTLACRYWGRSGYYQSGSAMVSAINQDTARYSTPRRTDHEHLRCAGRQFRKACNTVASARRRSVRTHFSDDYLWPCDDDT